MDQESPRVPSAPTPVPVRPHPSPSWEPMVSSPQALVPAMLDLTSAVTAGNTPMVTVKMKQTERAGTKIWRKGTQPHVFMTSVH